MQQNTSQPIHPEERTASVDVLRGFALGGVVVANLISLATFVMPSAVAETLKSTRADKVVDFLFVILVDHKFITLFSLLFGYGFGVIMERVSGKGMNETFFFSRRMTILFVAGVVHIFFWWGEILHTYALCGLIMLAFRKASNRTLLTTAFFLLLVPTVGVRYWQIKTGAFAPAQSNVVFTEYLDLSLRTGLADVLRANALTFRYVYLQCLANITDILEVLGKFLIGYVILRQGYLKNVEAHLPAIKRFLWCCLPLAMVYVTEMVLLLLLEPKITNIAVRLLLNDFNRLGVLALTFTYATTLVWLYHAWPGFRLFGAFRYIGMMSLSNYLTQTVLYVLVLHGIGLGWMGKLHVYQMALLALGIYLAQAVASKLWLARFQYGPAEWLWRQASYGRRFPIRKRALAS